MKIAFFFIFSLFLHPLLADEDVYPQVFPPKSFIDSSLAVINIVAEEISHKKDRTDESNKEELQRFLKLKIAFLSFINRVPRNTVVTSSQIDVETTLTALIYLAYQSKDKKIEDDSVDLMESILWLLNNRAPHLSVEAIFINLDKHFPKLDKSIFIPQSPLLQEKNAKIEAHKLIEGIKKSFAASSIYEPITYPVKPYALRMHKMDLVTEKYPRIYPPADFNDVAEVVFSAANWILQYPQEPLKNYPKYILLQEERIGKFLTIANLAEPFIEMETEEDLQKASYYNVNTYLRALAYLTFISNDPQVIRQGISAIKKIEAFLKQGAKKDQLFDKLASKLPELPETLFNPNSKLWSKPLNVEAYLTKFSNCIEMSIRSVDISQ